MKKRFPFNNNSLIDILHQHAQTQADQVAYTFLSDGEMENSHLTYLQLDEKASAIALLLQRKGALPGDRILLLYPPGWEYICGFMGCLYAGMVAVPSYPPRLSRSDVRLQAIAHDAQARIALTTSEIAASIQPRLTNAPALASLAWLTVESIDPTSASQWQRPQVKADTLAFLQYTSGSTSQPKGVMVSHGNLIHNQQIIGQCFEHGPESCVVTWLPPYHDMGLIGSLLQPLYLGFPSILMPPTAFLQSPIRWLRAIARYRATTSGAPNFAYDLCTQKITDEQKQGLDLSTWDVAFCGAEPIRKETLERFAATFAPYGFRREAFYACYGLAEATLMVSGGIKSTYPAVQRFAADELAQNRVALAGDDVQNGRDLVSCGTVSSDQQLLIVDPLTLERRPDLRVGEIWLRGESVAQGYWNNPDETAKNFGAQLPNEQETYLRTGDLGFLYEGELYIAGRAKDLIIIRGRNHYPQDIELTVEQAHSALQPAGSAAFAVDVAGEERLIVVCETQRTSRHIPVDEVARAARQAVAQQHELQIDGFILLKPGHLPRTSSGKVQRRACQKAFLDGTLEELGRSMLNQTELSTTAENVLDRDQILSAAPDVRRALLEAQLRQQVGQALKISPAQVDLYQPLVSLGLDSLAAVAFQSQIELHWQVQLSLEDLLGEMTLEILTNQILAQFAISSSPQALILPNIATVSRDERLPLSFDQESLWLLDQMQPGNPVYNIPLAIRLSGSLDVAAIQASLNSLVARHESLRTVFRDSMGQPAQRIFSGLTIACPMDDLSVLPLQEQDAQLRKISLAEAARPFNVTEGPLLRVRFVRLTVERHVLLLTIHHLISDLWSVTILVRELAAAYQAHVSRDNLRLPALPIQYADFASWQRQSLTDSALADKLAYWRQTLAGTPQLLALPTDHPRPAEQRNVGGSLSFRIPATLCERLGEISRQQGVTLYTALLSGFEMVLQRYSGQTDIIIGTPVAGRPHPALDAVIGFFAHPVILRTNLAGDPSFQDVLKQVWQTALHGYAHAVPFAKVLAIAPARENKSYHPVYQVSFGYFNQWDEALNAADVRFELAEIEKPATDFDLFLTLFNHQGGLRGVMEYDSALFTAETIQQLIDFYCATLEILANDLQTRLSQLRLPTALARKRAQTVTITATFTAEPIQDMLAFWLQKIGQKAQIAFAPFNQVFQQLLDPASLLNQNVHGVNILLVRFEDWGMDRPAQNLVELVHALKLATSHTSTPIVLCLCPASPVLYAEKAQADAYLLLEKQLADQLVDLDGVLVVQSAEINALYPVAQYYDAYTDKEGHIPYTPVFFTALATMLARKVYALQNPPRKVIVLDCDQTLWQGICGEDGPDGIVLDAPRKRLQEFMVGQQAKGRLLCLCSKNNEPDVWEVFARRGEMPLKREHLSAWRINWQAKSENLKSLARELNLGLDSFIFLDDSPLECAEVKANCPGVEVLLLPAEVERIPKFLAHVWAFDQLKVTQEDRQRTLLYRQNSEREQLRSSVSSLDEFLASLALQVEISPVRPEQIDRVAQLTQRTNQFNLSTIRRNEAEILALTQSGLRCETVSARDRFGDYGLVGVLMFTIEGNTLEVDTFLLSCRAMGRRVEQQMLARLLEIAQGFHLEYVNLCYHTTLKNQPIHEFLRTIGGSSEIPIQGGTKFRIPADQQQTV